MTNGKETDAKEIDALFKKLSGFVDPAQLKAFGLEPEALLKMMKEGGNKHGQQHLCKMFKQGKKFFKKFMKQCHKAEKKEKKCEKREEEKGCGMPWSWGQFAGKCEKNGKKPFAAMCEMW